MEESFDFFEILFSLYIGKGFYIRKYDIEFPESLIGIDILGLSIRGAMHIDTDLFCKGIPKPHL